MRKYDLENRFVLLQEEMPSDGGSSGGGASLESKLSDAFATGNSYEDLSPEVVMPEAVTAEDSKGPELGENNTQTTSTTTTSTSNDSWIWDEVKEVIGEEFVLPEGLEKLSSKEKFNVLKEYLGSKENDDDDFIQSYKEAKKAGIESPDDFIQMQMQEKAILNADDDSLLKYSFENAVDDKGNKKYKTEEIDEYIESLNAIQKTEKAKEIRKALLEERESQISNKKQEIATQRDEALKQWDTSRQENVAKTLEKFKDVKEVGGIPFTESDLQEFAPIFDKLTQYNPQTGRLYVDDYLQSDNDRIFKMMYLLHKSDKGEISKHISDVKESIKADVLKKMNITPNIQTQTSFSNSERVPNASDFF